MYCWQGLTRGTWLLSSLELSDIKVYEPQIRALLGTASHFCEVVVLKLRTAGPDTRHVVVGGLERLVLWCRGGSYLRRIDSCITQLTVQGPSRTCNESKEEEEEFAEQRSGEQGRTLFFFFLITLKPRVE